MVNIKSKNKEVVNLNTSINITQSKAFEYILKSFGDKFLVCMNLNYNDMK